eukprot:745978-Prymnesium_polylepis.1
MGAPHDDTDTTRAVRARTHTTQRRAATQICGSRSASHIIIIIIRRAGSSIVRSGKANRLRWACPYVRPAHSHPGHRVRSNTGHMCHALTNALTGCARGIRPRASPPCDRK